LGDFAFQFHRFCKPISPKLQSKEYAIKPKSAIDHLTTTFGSMLFLYKKCVVFRKYFIPLHSLIFAESLVAEGGLRHIYIKGVPTRFGFDCV